MVDAVARVVGVQAQDLRASRLAVRVRTVGLTSADVDVAVRERAVVRTWAMRGTLHMVDAADYFWVNDALGAYFAQRGAGRRRQLGLDDALLERAAGRLEVELRKPLTRPELVERLELPIDPTGQAPAHLLAWAANVGLVCRGPEGPGDEPTYVLVREWLGPRPDVRDSLVTLARRYLAAYGPATAEDLAAWSGLPVTRVRPGLDAVGVRTADGVYATGDDRTPLDDGSSRVRLLGHFDAYLLGYRGRDLAVPAELRRRVQTGGGFVMPTVLVDGQVVGTWRPVSTKNGLLIDVTGETPGGIGNEVADIGRFLGVHTALTTTAG
ncbi:winged helix DNA-binding domain-containing protein [Actinophytocola xinjiangensis]|uniref:winged helix DNA-binding domain-containing protein n=1 Tax=Actinophytocola xinjiangensis TaxID=485602 RepID=UPI000A45370D|nr:winged helix DNA-binding domain-containing protein [Actinophytocola xinjiangensis]